MSPLRRVSRNYRFLPLLLILAAAACSPSASSYSTSLFRFQEAEPSILLVSVPDELDLATSHPTLAGAAGNEIESRSVPLSLAELPAAWAGPLARTLRFFKDAPLRAGGDAAPWVRRLRADPRRAGEPDYQLLPPYRTPQPARDPLAAPPPGETDLDTGHRFCLVGGERIADQLPCPQWFAFDPAAIARRFGVTQMLLVTVEQVRVYDTSGRPGVSARLGGYLVDLQKPLLAARFLDDLDLVRPDGPAGMEAALCGSLAELRADDWAPLRRTLARLGERWGFVLAARLGWIGPDRLQEEVARWTRENAAALDRAR